MASETFIPSGRDHPVKSATRWLKFKRLDDDIGLGLWRIHDNLYDFTNFIQKHPGGAEWIQMTEGRINRSFFEL